LRKITLLTLLAVPVLLLSTASNAEPRRNHRDPAAARAEVFPTPAGHQPHANRRLRNERCWRTDIKTGKHFRVC